MPRRSVRILLIGVGAFFLALILGRAGVDLYTDALWYAGLGYLDVFWTRLGIGFGVQGVAALIAAGLVLLNLWLVSRHIGPVRVRRRYGNIEIAEQVPRVYVVSGMVIVAVLAGWWLAALKFGGGASLGVMAWLRRVEWGVADPLFGHDISFYVFSLPVYFQIADYLLLVALWSGALVALGYVLVGAVRWRENRLEIDERPRVHFVILLAGIVLILALRYWLGRYGLVLEGNGIGGGIGYTDVHARLPAHRAMATLSLMVVGALLYGAWRRSWLAPAVSMGLLILAAIVVGHIYPSLIQRFRVEPNQLAREAAFIEWNLEFTRQAYALDNLNRQPFSYNRLAIPSWDDMEPSLSKLPLWDADPLKTTYDQIQAIFGYYHFPRVEYGRYGQPGNTQQVALGVREFNVAGLPPDARTWQTLRLNPDYVRGMGAVVTPAAEAQGQGEPVLWLQNLPPQRHPQAAPQVDLAEPSVFFGQTMMDYVILVPGREGNLGPLTGTAGRDFPAGVPLSSFGRKAAFAWRFADVNLLFSGEITDDSRFVFRRGLRDRLRAVAPFILWDPEPYPVIHDGRIVWIADGYTATSSFPLARALDLEGMGRVRYFRNSVKATLDAVTGHVAVYAFREEDPVLETYRRVFPNLVQPIQAMPDGLRRHLRYPSLYLRSQASILTEYHLRRPEQFYAGQDVWQLPRAARNGLLRPYRPIHALMQLPGEDRPEYLLTIPFIARERQNMTALLVGRSDPPNQGELMLLELPRDQLVPGPAQVEALIEQDPIIAPQFALWRQAGSDVELGHLRVVPLEHTFLYVKPLFLSARAGAIPELRRVLVSDGREVRMEPTLGEAVRALRGAALDGDGDEPRVPQPPGEPLPVVPELDGWTQRARELMDLAERRLRDGDWAGFGRAWDELRELLERSSSPQPRP